MRVVALTTSYPRDADDHAGRFVADVIERVRERGVDVLVVAPIAASGPELGFDDHGLAFGAGMAANLRARPWALPGMLASMAVAARRAARGADLVHAHWLPSGAVAALTGLPYVVSLHGTDVELARRLPLLARPVLRGARAVLCVSSALADDARRLGARGPLIVPNGVELPGLVPEPSAGGTVLFAGRLSPEKGIEEFLEATDGLDRRIVGDGPLRALVPEATGFVSRARLAREYETAAVVVVPSRREGFGLVCAEAMAHARPVVTTGVGGLADLVRHGETGIVVAPGDPRGLRVAIDSLLADATLRRRLGEAGRAHVAAHCSWPQVVEQTLAAYAAALGRGERAT